MVRGLVADLAHLSLDARAVALDRSDSASVEFTGPRVTDARHGWEVAGLDVADQCDGIDERAHLDLPLVRRIDIVPRCDRVPGEAEGHSRPLSEDSEWLLHCEAAEQLTAQPREAEGTALDQSGGDAEGTADRGR